jgi:hypothetical protein
VSFEDVSVLQRGYHQSDGAVPGFSLDPKQVSRSDDVRAVMPGLAPELADRIADGTWQIWNPDLADVVQGHLFFNDPPADALRARGLPEYRTQLWALHNLLREGPVFNEARYDGGSAGTEVGMSAFYTDLVMKDWTTGVGEGVPPGFRYAYPGQAGQTVYRFSDGWVTESQGGAPVATGFIAELEPGGRTLSVGPPEQLAIDDLSRLEVVQEPRTTTFGELPKLVPSGAQVFLSLSSDRPIHVPQPIAPNSLVRYQILRTKPDAQPEQNTILQEGQILRLLNSGTFGAPFLPVPPGAGAGPGNGGGPEIGRVPGIGGGPWPVGVPVGPGEQIVVVDDCESGTANPQTPSEDCN